MPVMDFETVDELNPHVFYNWGYDPAQYFSLKAPTSSNPNDPMSRIIEFTQVVSKYHEAGIRVNLDVVFNHVFDMEKSPFEKMYPVIISEEASMGPFLMVPTVGMTLTRANPWPASSSSTVFHYVSTLMVSALTYGHHGCRHDE